MCWGMDQWSAHLTFILSGGIQIPLKKKNIPSPYKQKLKYSGALRAQTMLMPKQHLYKSHTIEIYGHCRSLLPWPRLSCWFFLQSRVEKLLELSGIEPKTFDLGSQSGAYYLSANHNDIENIHPLLLVIHSDHFFHS